MNLNTLTVPTLIPVDVNFVLFIIYKLLYLVSYKVTLLKFVKWIILKQFLHRGIVTSYWGWTELFLFSIIDLKSKVIGQITSFLKNIKS